MVSTPRDNAPASDDTITDEHTSERPPNFTIRGLVGFIRALDELGKTDEFVKASETAQFDALSGKAGIHEFAGRFFTEAHHALFIRPLNVNFHRAAVESTSAPSALRETLKGRTLGEGPGKLYRPSPLDGDNYP